MLTNYKKQANRTVLYLLVGLLLCLLLVPSEWERLQFLLLLLLPIIFSIKYFNLDREQLKTSIRYLGLYIFFSLFTFVIHVLQLQWELSNQNGLFGFKFYIDPLLSMIPYNDGVWLWQLSTPLLDRFFVYIYIHGFVFCILGLCLYYLVTGQPRKILLAMFAGHFLQYLLILPFHFW